MIIGVWGTRKGVAPDIESGDFKREGNMPKFLDYHAKMPQLPPDVVRQVQADIKAGRADQFGVKPLNAFIGVDGRGYCFAEAPNADAVCRSHEAKGIALPKSDVVEVQTLA